jgi:regulation of enolase protein 1 (concanavalin A-like superfamily)
MKGRLVLYSLNVSPHLGTSPGIGCSTLVPPPFAETLSEIGMDKTTRRSFLAKASAYAGMLAAMKPILVYAADTDPFAGMTWLNEPLSAKRVGDKLVVRSRPKTDFWRKAYYGYITDNGHFFHMRAEGDFVLQARVNGQYAALYDQAGLMVRVNAENWMKYGTEFFDGKRHASVVFTREYSDWSTMPDLTETGPVWWRAVRKGESVETLCSLDGKNFVSVRQGYFPASPAEVGVMCAAPEGRGIRRGVRSEQFVVGEEIKLQLLSVNGSRTYPSTAKSSPN